jgi:hypothetical protein
MLIDWRGLKHTKEYLNETIAIFFGVDFIYDFINLIQFE